MKITRKLLAGILSAAMIVSLASCSSPASSSQGESSAAGDSSAAQSSGEGQTGGSTEFWNDKLMNTNNSVLEEFSAAMKDNSGVDVEIVSYPDEAAYTTAVQQSIKEASAPGMFTWWSGEKLETLVKNGLVEDLTDLWDSDFVSAGVPEGIKDAFTVDGKVYAAPYSILYNPWTGGNFSVLFLNTVVITVFTIIFTILLASPAGFALAKLNLKGGKLIYNYLILGMIIPFQTIMVPLMKICRQLQAFNYSFTLIAIFTATSIILPVMLYTSFYKSVPDEIVEAAKLDGCGMIRILGKILFPLTKSVNATVAIFVGMYAWRDYLIPSLFATDPNARTLVVGIYNFTGSYFNNWPVIFAAIVIQSIPLVVLFLVFQKSFVDGITSGAVKG